MRREQKIASRREEDERYGKPLFPVVKERDEDERVYIGCPCGDDDCHDRAAGHRWCPDCERHVRLMELTDDGECPRHPSGQGEDSIDRLRSLSEAAEKRAAEEFKERLLSREARQAAYDAFTESKGAPVLSALKAAIAAAEKGAS